MLKQYCIAGPFIGLVKQYIFENYFLHAASFVIIKLLTTLLSLTHSLTPQQLDLHPFPTQPKHQKIPFPQHLTSPHLTSAPKPSRVSQEQSSPHPPHHTPTRTFILPAERYPVAPSRPSTQDQHHARKMFEPTAIPSVPFFELGRSAAQQRASLERI